MKFKYPKKITIGGRKFKLIYNKNDDTETHFSFKGDEEHPFPHIFFGIKNVHNFLEIVIHELKEVIQVEQDTRLTKGNDGMRVFHYTHAEHTDLCSRLAGHLKKFIK